MTWQLLQALSEWLFIGSAVAATLFVVIYGLRSPWWRRDPVSGAATGRVLFMFMAVIATIMDLVVFFDRVWAPSAHVVLVLSGILYGWLFVTLTSLNWLLLRAQHRDRKETARGGAPRRNTGWYP